MPPEDDLRDALEDFWLEQDVVWLAKRISWREVTPDDAWVDHVDIPAQFFRALADVWPYSNGSRIPVEVESHALRGEATAQYVRRRAFLQWDVGVATSSADCQVGGLIIFAIRNDCEPPFLWCWICETLAEDEYAEAVFNLGQPSTASVLRGFPVFASIKRPQP